MLYSDVKMSGIAHFEAPLRLMSSEIEARLAPVLARFGVSPDLLKKLSGIESRQMFDPAVPPSDGATQAAEAAVARSAIDRTALEDRFNTKTISQVFVGVSSSAAATGPSMPSLATNFSSC